MDSFSSRRLAWGRRGRAGLVVLAVSLAGPPACQASGPLPPAVSAAALTPLLPDLPNQARPDPEPVYPAGWDAFAPPVSAAPPAAGAPILAEWTRAGVPGDTLILTGSRFSNAAGADTQFLTYGGTIDTNAVRSSAPIERLDGLKAAIALPTDLPASSLYLIWPMNSSGCGYPAAVNRTEAWWVGPDQAAGGDTVSVYGRNLSHGNGTTLSWVYLVAPGGAGQWLTVTAVNPYRVRCQLPAGLPPGGYQLWVHNGHGGSYGWSSPLHLAVRSPYAWNSAPFNVRAYGAAGDGLTDDTAAIDAAYAAAARQSQSGVHTTLYFPSGVYLLDHGLGVQGNLRFLGDGIDRTFLKCSTRFAQVSTAANRMGLLFADGTRVNQVEINGLTLDANGHFSRAANADHLVYLQFAAGSGDIRFTDVRVQILVSGFGCVFVNGATRLAYANCVFIGGDVMSFNGTQHAFEGCSFYGANDSPESIIQRGTSELSVSDCYAANFDLNSPTGQGLGRFLAANGDYGTQANVYVGANTTVNCGPRAGAADQNSGEHILCEGNTNWYEGNPYGATPTSVTFGDLAADLTGQTAIITSGPGLGQYRSVTGYDAVARTITVSPAWNLPPDTTSTVVIANTANRWVVYQNVFDGKDSYAANATAMAGIELYGGCFDWIGDGNTITRMCTGLYVVGLQQASAPVGINPSFFNYFAHNIISSCFQGIYADCSIPVRTPDTGIALLGNVFRGNTLTDITQRGAGLWTNTPSTPGVPLDMTVFDRNTFTNLPQGIDCDDQNSGSRTRNILIYRNRLNLGTASAVGAFAIHFGPATSDPALAANTCDNYGISIFAGARPGPILETPIRSFSLAGSGGANAGAAMTIVNSGATPLTWGATSDSSWLTLSPASGTINGGDSAIVSLTCDPSTLPPGSYLGTLTLSGAAQTQSVTVTFTVPSAIRLRPVQLRRSEQ